MDHRSLPKTRYVEFAYLILEHLHRKKFMVVRSCGVEVLRRGGMAVSPGCGERLKLTNGPGRA